MDMSEIYEGTMWLVAGTTAPDGFALCNGAVIPITQNQSLFALIGTSFGGNGTTTFGLPNVPGPAGYSWVIAMQGIYPSKP